MRRFITLCILTFTLSGAVMAQQMSDEQVIQYLKDAQSQGKSQTQITTELFRRGVTKEQVERIKEKYEARPNVEATGAKQRAGNSQQRTRNPATDNSMNPNDPGNRNVNQRQMNNHPNSRPARDDIRNLNSGELSSGGGQGVLMSDSDGYYFEKQYPEVPVIKKNERKIFGREMFTNPSLSFEPNSNIATPVNYRLGPGDEVIIDIWGTSENTIRETISPEGSIVIANVGPVYLSGMTINEAARYVHRELSKFYAGLTENSSRMKLSL